MRVSRVGMSMPWLIIFGIYAQSFHAEAGEMQLVGKWASNLGVIKIQQHGKHIDGRLIWAAETCPFQKGYQVLKGILLEDSLSGKWRYCLKGKQCEGNQWAPVVMLVARGGRVLSGAAHYRPSVCRVGGKRKGSGIMIRKLRKKPQAPKPDPKPDIAQAATPFKDEKGNLLEEEIKTPDPNDFTNNQAGWRENMQVGKSHLERGLFERGRSAFLSAIDLDPTRPEAYNGVGVTYYARSDYEKALFWYKKSLEVNPDFQDAFYNMACIYALMKKNQLAIRYLNIALLNGYVEHQVMEQDADLQNLRSDPRYKEILDRMKKYQHQQKP